MITCTDADLAFRAGSGTGNVTWNKVEVLLVLEEEKWCSGALVLVSFGIGFVSYWESTGH